MADDRPSPSGTLHSHVLDLLGLAITNAELEPSRVVTIDELETRYAVSRSVIREALRVLESMGMIQSRRRVGVLVQPMSEWNLYDPQIIRWRLASTGRVAQLRSLIELRRAIEPEAARLAAIRAPLDDASDIMGLSGKLWAAGRSGDMDRFIELDIQFHKLLLSSSGNEMFGKLDSLIAELISGRATYGLMPQDHSPEGLQFHVEVAKAIQAGDPEAAQTAMLQIVCLAIDEMSPLWQESDPEHQAYDAR